MHYILLTTQLTPLYLFPNWERKKNYDSHIIDLFHTCYYDDYMVVF